MGDKLNGCWVLGGHLLWWPVGVVCMFALTKNSAIYHYTWGLKYCPDQQSWVPNLYQQTSKEVHSLQDTYKAPGLMPHELGKYSSWFDLRDLGVTYISESWHCHLQELEVSGKIWFHFIWRKVYALGQKAAGSSPMSGSIPILDVLPPPPAQSLLSSLILYLSNSFSLPPYHLTPLPRRHPLKHVLSSGKPSQIP